MSAVGHRVDTTEAEARVQRGADPDGGRELRDPCERRDAVAAGRRPKSTEIPAYPRADAADPRPSQTHENGSGDRVPTEISSASRSDRFVRVLVGEFSHASEEERLSRTLRSVIDDTLPFGFEHADGLPANTGGAVRPVFATLRT